MSAPIDRPTIDLLDEIAQRLFRAHVFASEVNSPDMAFAILLAGYELGYSPMASVRDISLVKGKVSLDADAQIALCVRSPEVCKYFRLIESTSKVATYETLRAGSPEPVRLSYTFDQAKAAGLTGSSTWQKHPDAMLRARCGAALARSTYPDLVAGIYVPDEAEEIRRDIPDLSEPEAPANDQPSRGDAPSLVAYRARVASAATLDALVATHLELSPSVAQHVDAAKVAIRARVVELGEAPENFARSVSAAAGITKDPQAWATVAAVLSGLTTATSKDAIGSVVKTHGAAASRLPQALRDMLNKARIERLAALASPPTDAAAQFESDLRAAADISSLESLGDKIAAAATAGSITPDQLRALASLQDTLATAMEREAA